LFGNRSSDGSRFVTFFRRANNARFEASTIHGFHFHSRIGGVGIGVHRMNFINSLWNTGVGFGTWGISRR